MGSAESAVAEPEVDSSSSLLSFCTVVEPPQGHRQRCELLHQVHVGQSGTRTGPRQQELQRMVALEEFDDHANPRIGQFARGPAPLKFACRVECRSFPTGLSSGLHTVRQGPGLVAPVQVARIPRGSGDGLWLRQRPRASRRNDKALHGRIRPLRRACPLAGVQLELRAIDALKSF